MSRAAPTGALQPTARGGGRTAHLALLAGCALARVLAPRFVIECCALGGRIAARFSPWRETVRANLAAAAAVLDRSGNGNDNRLLPSRSPQVTDVFAAYGRYWGEFLVFAVRPAWFDARLRRVEGAEHLRRAAAGGPVCALTGHLGNWDLGVRFARRYLPGLSVVAERLDPPRLFGLFCAARGCDGGEVVPAERAGTRLYKLWRRGGHVGLVADRVFGAGERTADFLGGRRRFPSAGMDLGRRAGAALVPVFLLREGNGYVLRAHPPLPPEEDPVQAFARALEDEVRRHPEQWCMLYPACDAREATGLPRLDVLAGVAAVSRVRRAR